MTNKLLLLLVVLLSFFCLKYYNKSLYYKKWKDECVMRQMPPSLLENLDIDSITPPIK